MTSVRSIRVQCCVHAEHHYDIQQCNDITAKIEELSHIAETFAKRQQQKHHHERQRQQQHRAAAARRANTNNALFRYSTISFVLVMLLLLCITSSLELICYVNGHVDGSSVASNILLLTLSFRGH